MQRVEAGGGRDGGAITDRPAGGNERLVHLANVPSQVVNAYNAM